MNQVQTEVIFLNLLRQADEFIFSILGMNPTPDSGSFRARVSALFDMFKADKYNFVLSPVHLGFLATLIKEYGAFRKSEITQIGTPEILIGQIRWEDIYDKPEISGGGGSLPYMRMWQGNSDFSTRIDLPETFLPAAMIVFEYAYGYRASWTKDTDPELCLNDGSIIDISVSAGVITLPPGALCNISGKYYYAIIFEGAA